MKSKNETFAGVFDSLAYRYDLRPVFDDLLTIMLCTFSQNPLTGKSHDEDLYMETIAKYEKEDVRELFPKLVALLIVEMEERAGSSTGNDVLGEFYELNFCRKGAGQFFTPWPVCEFMAACTIGEPEETGKVQRVIDPCCGSGRMLVAGSKRLGWQHEYYGIDIDHTCVKMAALNLFLNGIFHAEVMWADALAPDDFRISYRTSFLPFGIFRIKEKEHSRLWHLNRNSFPGKPPQSETKPLNGLTLPSETAEKAFGQKVSQISLF